MSSDWYIKINNAEHGPLTSERLKQLAQQGKVMPDTLVRKGQAGKWHRANDVHGLFTTPFSSPTGRPIVRTSPASVSTDDSQLEDSYDEAALASACDEAVNSATESDTLSSSGEAAPPQAKRTAPAIPPQPERGVITTASSERACPFCGETILAVAKKCKHCGEFLDETARSVSAGMAKTSIAPCPEEEIAEALPADDMPEQPQSVFACPSCGSDNYTKVSLAYAQGTSSISSTTTGIGLAAGGFGVGGASTTGQQQSVLAQKLKPPTDPSGAIGCLIVLCVILFFSGAISGGWAPMMVFVIPCIVLLVAKINSVPKYQESMAQWQKLFICLRCGTLFRRR